MLDQIQEKSLMKQVAKGDKSAFRTLALSYQKPLVSFCMKVMNGHEAFAEDVVQQTLITWWQKAALWKSAKGGLKAWVFTIAMNKCKDYLKRPHVSKAIEEGDIVVENDDKAMETKSKRKHIIMAMKNLSDKQKQVVWMYYFDETPQKEIAKKLSMTVKNVEVNLYRAKKEMRRKLKTDKDWLL